MKGDSIQIKISMDEGKPIVTGINKDDDEVIVCQYLEKGVYNFFNGFDDGIVVTKDTLRMYRDVINKMIGADKNTIIIPQSIDNE